MLKESKVYAPGSRILVRDEEWIIKKVETINNGKNKALTVTGVSELVKNHEAIFLDDIDEIVELKPEKTELIADDSTRYRKSRLYVESLLKRTPPTENKIFIGHKGAMNPAEYQLIPTDKALNNLRPRILLADGVGLGKTLEVGILVSELIKRGRGERILVVTLKSMMEQFQKELWSRFSIPLVKLDSRGIQKVRSFIPANKNPFSYYNRVIISIDTLKQDGQYRHYLEKSQWDIIIIDECHNVANLGNERNKLASLLARTCDSLILTSATPHNGNPESFSNLINMLEPTVVSNPKKPIKEECEKYFVRRFKKDIEDQVGSHFKERKIIPHHINLTDKEENAYNYLLNVTFTALKQGKRKDHLYKTVLLKGLLSSPSACIDSIKERIKNLDRQTKEKPERTEEYNCDKVKLEELKSLLEKLDASNFSKYQKFVQVLKEIKWDGTEKSPRVVLFSERIETLKFLERQLKADFNLKDGTYSLFYAGLSDSDQQEIVDSFGKQDSKLRILLASDMASEGVNLHFFCNNMIHFDIPWSFITLEQRNGRIDRYGQENTPYIRYLLNTSSNANIEADFRILDKLIEKEDQARKNLGDVALMMKLYDSELEEEKIEDVFEGKSSIEELTKSPFDDDFLSKMFGSMPVEEVKKPDLTAETISLYKDNIDFLENALQEVKPYLDDNFESEFSEDKKTVTLFIPENQKDLIARSEFLPDEVFKKNDDIILTIDPDQVQKSIADARKKTGEWPKFQYFWNNHYIMDWILDKLLLCYNRHQAPVISVKDMNPDEFYYLFQGIVSNKRSQAVVADWFAVKFKNDKFEQILNFNTLLGISGFNNGLVNFENKFVDLESLKHNLEEAVKKAKEHLTQKRLERGKALTSDLTKDTRKIKKWHTEMIDLLEGEKQRLSHNGTRKIPEHLNTNLERRINDANKLYERRENWLKETMETDPNPYMKLVAVFCGLKED